MRFGNCSECGEYNYLESQGTCPTCLSGAGTVYLQLDRLAGTLRQPEVFRVIANTIENDPRVVVSNDVDSWHDDLDFLEDKCVLYHAGIGYRYSSYTGDTLAERVEKAVADALDDSVDAYEGCETKFS